MPRHSVGVVIGRNGEMIKKIQSDAGVKIQFKPGECGSTANSFKLVLILTYAGTLNTHKYLKFWCTLVLLNNSLFIYSVCFKVTIESNTFNGNTTVECYLIIHKGFPRVLSVCTDDDSKTSKFTLFWHFHFVFCSKCLDTADETVLTP